MGEGEIIKARVGKEGIYVTQTQNSFFLAWYKMARTHPYLYYSMEGSSTKIFSYKINLEADSKITDVTNSHKKNLDISQGYCRISRR